MREPKMKRVVTVGDKSENGYFVYFWANETVANCAKEFGFLAHVQGSCYRLSVDRRYDFNEVIEWLESFND